MSSHPDASLFRVPGIKFIVVALLIFGPYSESKSQGKSIVDLRDFRGDELKSAGFTVSQDAKFRIYALGGGESKNFENWFGDDEPQLYAGGWIIDAETREAVWEMDFDNTSGRGGRRSFEGEVALSKGSYEVYFVAYAFHQRDGFSGFSINIDHRRDHPLRRSFGGKLLSYLGLDDESRYEDFQEFAQDWGITITVAEGAPSAFTLFEPPLKEDKPVFSLQNVGDEEYVRKTLKIGKDVSLRIRAIGEGLKNDGMFDYGWLVSAKTRERVWEMTLRNTKHAGGAMKNRLYEGEVSLSKGEYELVFFTDGSHSGEDWNAKPPYDPYHYGFALFTKNEGDKKTVSISDFVEEEKNIIVKLTNVRDEDFVNAGFTLTKDVKVRVYALGEIPSDGDAADYGWIVNTKTRERVWSMDRLETDHAGGAQKNRVVDEIITLPKGSYMAYYQTDGSHAYHSWNSDPPFDEDHWGLTVYGVGESFDPKSVTAYKEVEEENVIAQVVRVRDGRHERQTFRVDKPTLVRVYAIGEAMDRQLYDYGWIEETETGKTVWEMTYRMTEHAGGAKKNRMVSTTLTLKPGEYELHYETDGSHSFGEWNDDPPEDRTHWGITVYKER